MSRQLLPLLAILVMAACQDRIIKVLGPSNDERLKLVADTLRFEAEDLDNVHDTRTWPLAMSTTKAKVRHRSFVSHGVARITILDDLGDTVYNRIPLENELDNTTSAGRPGLWTVTLELFGAIGRVDFTIRNKP